MLFRSEHQVYSDKTRQPPKWPLRRVINPGEELPPIMTTYGRAPRIPPEVLGSMTVFGYGIPALLGGPGTIRHLVAPELAAAHGFHDWQAPVWWDTDLQEHEQLIQALGDAIAPPQAAWCTHLLLQAAGLHRSMVHPIHLMGEYLARLRATLEIGRAHV